MKSRTTRTLGLALAALVFFGATTTVVQAKGTASEQRADVLKMRDEVLAALYKEDASVKEKIKKAEGYAVFTNVGVNLLLASFAGGHGVVVDRKGHETYMKMASAGIGIGLGVKDFRAVFVFRSKKKLEDFIEKGWDFGGQADAAAQSDQKGASLAKAATAIPDVDVYQITKNGLALQATLQGTKYWRDRDLND